MANSSFETQLDVLNKKLKSEGIGKIYSMKKSFYFKAYLPDKVTPDWSKLKQQWVATRLKAEKENLRKVEKLAIKLHDERIRQTFVWFNWLATEEELSPKKKSLKIADIYAALEKDFWDGVLERTPKKKRNWKSIAQYLAPRNKLTKPHSIKLEHHKLLTSEYIISTVKKFKTKKTRADMMKYCLRLARFGEIPDLRDVEKFSEKLDKYEPKTRDAKDPELMYNTVKELRSHKRFGWAIAAIFTYGCRVSEVWTLKPKEGHIAKCSNNNKEDAKMKLKYCYAIPKSYVEEFDLMNVQRNVEMIGVENYDAEKAAAEGYAMAKWLREYFGDKEERFQLYDLRHYWGIKSTKSDLSTANAAESMGHSVKIHQDTYLSTFGEKDAREVAAKKL